MLNYVSQFLTRFVTWIVGTNVGRTISKYFMTFACGYFALRGFDSIIVTFFLSTSFFEALWLALPDEMQYLLYLMNIPSLIAIFLAAHICSFLIRQLIKHCRSFNKARPVKTGMANPNQLGLF